MAVIDALEDRLNFCSNTACQNGLHNHRVIFNFGFFVRGFRIHHGEHSPRRDVRATWDFSTSRRSLGVVHCETREWKKVIEGAGIEEVD
jgi:hypothetical protein